MVEILVSVEFTTLDDEVPGGPQSFGAYIIFQATGFLRYAGQVSWGCRLQSFATYPENPVAWNLRYSPCPGKLFFRH